MNVDGSQQRRLSGDEHAAIMPTVTSDGKWVVYWEKPPVGDPVNIWLMRSDGSGAEKVITGAAKSHAVPLCWKRGGFYYEQDDTVRHFDPDSRVSQPVCALGSFYHLKNTRFSIGGLSHNERWMVGWTKRFHRKYQATNGTYRSGNAAAIFDLKHRDRIYFFGPGCEPTTPPKGSFLYHVGARNAPHSNRGSPDIMRLAWKEITVAMEKRSSYRIEVGYPDKKWGHEYFPRISNDNQWMVYGSSNGGHDHWSAQYEIFIHRLGEPDHRVRLTKNNATDNWPHLWVGGKKG